MVSLNISFFNWLISSYFSFIFTFTNRVFYIFVITETVRGILYHFFIVRRLSFIFCASLFSSLRPGDIFDGKGVQRLIAICLILLSLIAIRLLRRFKHPPSQAACPFSFYLTFSIRCTYTHAANSSVSFRSLSVDGGTLYGAALTLRHRHVSLSLSPPPLSLSTFLSLHPFVCSVEWA